jgi:TnpA family transposase
VALARVIGTLDEIFGNPTDLPLGEHTVDTAEQTLATFAIFNLAGLQLSPRIRDIGRLQLYRLGAASGWRSQYPYAGPLMGQPIQNQLIADHWNDLLRLVASMKFGHTTASLLIAKLHASSRQSSLAKALHEYGRLIRTTISPRTLTTLDRVAKWDRDMRHHHLRRWSPRRCTGKASH